MPIESPTPTYISDLNPLWPLGTDPKTNGDDNIRNLKATLQNTFENITGAVTVTHTEINKMARPVAAITGFDASDLHDGAVVVFLGRDTAGDGGGGVFTYDSGSSQTADGGTVFAPTGGGRLFRQGWTVLGFNGAVQVKWFGAKGDNSTDDTAEVNAAADAARDLNTSLLIDQGTFLVSSTLDFSTLTVRGISNQVSVIQATSAQFDVVKTEGNSEFFTFKIHGGWDGSTAGQTGDAIKIGNASNTAYNVHINHVRIEYAKRYAIYNVLGAYSSLHAVKINSCGLDAIYLKGTNSLLLVTTITITGETTASDCPNGYGLRLYEAASIQAFGFITENTKGIIIDGGDNRAISLIGVWQEGTTTGKFLTLPAGTSAGVGLTLKNCKGGGTDTVDNNSSWLGVDMDGNSGLIENSMVANGRKLSATSSEVTRTTTGSFTLTQLTIPPGYWHVVATAQTQNAGGGALTLAGIHATTDNTAAGVINATNAGFTERSAQIAAFGPSLDAKLQASFYYENANDTDVTLYLRSYLDVSAGTMAIKGSLNAYRQ